MAWDAEMERQYRRVNGMDKPRVSQEELKLMEDVISAANIRWGYDGRLGVTTASKKDMNKLAVARIALDDFRGKKRSTS